MSNLRFSRRLHDQYPGDADYACSVTRYRTRMPASEVALYIVAAIGIPVALFVSYYY